MRRVLRPCAVWAASAALLAACGSREVPVSIEVTHRFGDEPLRIGTAAPRSDVTLARVDWYLGRVRLQDGRGRWHAARGADAPEGDYHLIEATDAQSLRFAALDVPTGRYGALEFLLGVDPAHNAAGPQTGALDPAHGMFWTWKTGYLFFALEGRSPRSPESGGALTFHVGGDAALARTVVLPLPEPLDVAEGRRPVVHLSADLGAFFGELPIERIHTVMETGPAALLADRWATSFRVDHVHADDPDGTS